MYKSGLKVLDSHGYLYILYDKKNNITRIGTTQTKFERQRTQMLYYPFNLECFTFHVEYNYRKEARLHKFFNVQNKRMVGDWYMVDKDEVIEAIDFLFNKKDYEYNSTENILKEYGYTFIKDLVVKV